MLPYVLLILLMGMLGFLRYFCKMDSNVAAHRMGGVAFFVLCLILALRSPAMGVDLGYQTGEGYLSSFERLASLSFSDLAGMDGFLNYEPGYVLLNVIVGHVWKNQQFFIAVCALLSLLPICLVVIKMSKAPLFSCLIYFSLPVFEILFSGLRQGIALGICFYAIVFIRTRKFWKFLLAVLLAALFHDSCLVFLVAYPLYHIPMNRPVRLITFLLIPVAYIFRYQIVELYNICFRADAVPDNNSSYQLLLLLTLIYLICTFFCDQEDADMNGHLNLFFVSCLCQVVSSIYSAGIRMGYYFMIPVILLIPMAFEKMEFRLRVLAKWFAVAFFVLFAVYRILNSSWSGMYPYYAFWQEGV